MRAGLLPYKVQAETGTDRIFQNRDSRTKSCERMTRAIPMTICAWQCANNYPKDDIGRATVSRGGLPAVRKTPARFVDCEGDYLLPGFIDVHTDNFEKHAIPRPVSSGILYRGGQPRRDDDRGRDDDGL